VRTIAVMILLALAPATARADTTTPAAGTATALVPQACEVALRELAARLGLGHPEFDDEDDRWRLTFTNGAADCDADHFMVTVEHARGRSSGWRHKRDEGAVYARRHTGALAIAVEASFDIAHNVETARRFRAEATGVLDRCLAARR